MANQPKKYKKFVATAATATLVASAIVPVASAASLSDIAGNTHEEAINALVDAKVISGYPDGTFKPNKTLTRSDVVKLLGKYLEAEGYTAASDYATNPRFSDLSSKSNEELLKYAAIVADNGIFNGSNGKLLAGDNITRENMAIVLVRMINTLKDVSLEEFVASQNFSGDVKDLNSAKAEARTAIQVLDFYDITNPSVANFNPKGDTTRGQFATFLHKTINTDFAGASATTGTVKAINATTVEVTFPESIDDIKALTFKIDGLEVSSAVVKQTDAKTAVLTTAVQEAGKEYAVSVDGNVVGKFTGISAVIPTAVKVTTPSLQGTLGKEVTVKAEVTVPEGQSKAGIPVTFNIPSQNSLASAITAETKTDENGVATYTYTRYTAVTDDVIAYSTGDRSKFGAGKVYWASTLTVKDVTEATTLANGAKKVYEINAPGSAGQYVFVAFAENNSVAPDKAVTGAKVEGATTYILNADNTINIAATSATTNGNYPYSYTTGGKAVTAVKLDANGKANLVLSGSNAAVTPIIYAGTQPTVDTLGNLVFATTTKLPLYSATALQAKASTVTFAVNQVLKLDVKALVANNVAATYKNSTETGGRDYEVTLTKNDGTVAAFSPIKLAVKVPTSVSATHGILDAAGNTVSATRYSEGTDTVYVYTLATDKDGKAVFTVINTKEDAYVTPIVFVDNSNLLSGKLDKDDLQTVAETVYFKTAATATTAELTVTNQHGIEKDEIVGDGTDYAEYTYTLVDQHGKPRAISTNTTVAFEITTDRNDVVVDGVPLTQTARPGFPVVVNKVIGFNNTSVSIKVSSAYVTDVTVTATPSAVGYTLAPIVKTAKFSNAAAYTNPYTGNITDINFAANTLKLDNKGTINYGVASTVFLASNGDALSIAEFEAAVARGSKVHYKVDATGAITLQVRSALVTSSLTAAEQQQHVDNLIVAAAVGEVVSLPALTTGIVINSPKAITVEFTGVTGNVDINLPAGHVINKASITGTVTINALSSSSFVNEGSVAAIVINDLDGTRVENNGTIASILVQTSAPVKFEGEVLPTIEIASNLTEAKIDAPSTATILASENTDVKNSDGEKVKVEIKENPSQNLANAEAAKITSAVVKNNEIQLPVVADGYTVAVDTVTSESKDVKISSAAGVYTVENTATTVNTVDVVFVVTDVANKVNAKTASISIKLAAQLTADQKAFLDLLKTEFNKNVTNLDGASILFETREIAIAGLTTGIAGTGGFTALKNSGVVAIEIDGASTTVNYDDTKATKESIVAKTVGKEFKTVTFVNSDGTKVEFKVLEAK